VKKLFVVVTWIAALSLPATAAALCIVNCCVMQDAMRHCGGMAKTVAEMPLRNAAPAKTPAVLSRPDAHARVLAPVVTPPQTSVAFLTPATSERDVGLHVLLATFRI
jgi:hypothetical protein